MLNIELEIEQIDYAKCVESLLPALVEHCESKEAPNGLERFLVKLGSEAVPVALGLLDYLEEDTKDQLIVWLLTTHEAKFRKSANRHLEEALHGQIVHIGFLSAVDRPGRKLSLQALQVRIDYSSLLDSALVEDELAQFGREGGFINGAAKAALRIFKQMSPETMEKQGVALLNTEAVKKRMLSVFSNALRRAGLAVTLGSIAFDQSEIIHLPEHLDSREEDKQFLPETLEDALLDALALCLKEKVRKP